MKKRFVILTSLAVCITGILGGCGSDKEEILLRETRRRSRHIRRT